MSSNKHTLPVWTQFKCFHDSAEHEVKIKINEKVIYEKVFEPGIKHHVKFDEIVDFEKSGKKNFTIIWRGDHETADKWFMLDKWVINSQYVSPFNCMYSPYDNEYFQQLRESGNVEEQQHTRHAILYPGNTFSWFGELSWNMIVGNAIDMKKPNLNEMPEVLVGIIPNKIFLDEEEAGIERVRKKN